MNQDELNFIKDMLKSEGWRLYEKMNKEQIESLRLLATQQPGSIDENMRTWYSALAYGREQALEEIKNLL